MWPFRKKAPTAEQLVAAIEAAVAKVRQEYLEAWQKNDARWAGDFCPEKRLPGTIATMLFDTTLHLASTSRDKVEKTMIGCHIPGGLEESIRNEVAELLREKPWAKEVHSGPAWLTFRFTVG